MGVVDRDLQYRVLEGGHSDNRDVDVRKVIGI